METMRLVGVWELLGIKTVLSNGEEFIWPPYKGVLVYSEGGHMSAHLVLRDRADIAAAVPAEVAPLFREYLGYYGLYEMSPEAGEVVHVVEGCNVAAWEGGRQRRRASLRGDRLELSDVGRPSTTVLVWKRVEPATGGGELRSA